MANSITLGEFARDMMQLVRKEYPSLLVSIAAGVHYVTEDGEQVAKPKLIIEVK